MRLAAGSNEFDNDTQKKKRIPFDKIPTDCSLFRVGRENEIWAIAKGSAEKDGDGKNCTDIMLLGLAPTSLLPQPQEKGGNRAKKKREREGSPLVLLSLIRKIK